MFTIVAAAVVPWAPGVPQGVIVLLAGLVPGLAYWLGLRLSGRAWPAIGLAVALVVGTSAWPVLQLAIRSGAPYHVNHTLALIGLAIFLAEYVGRRRLWLAGVGWLVAVWSRQLCLAYALPLVYLAWRGPADASEGAASAESPGGQPEPARSLTVAARTDEEAGQAGPGRADRRASGSGRGRRVALAVAFVVVALGLPMTLNTLKFGGPLSSGYMQNYVERDDQFARDARAHGLFSLHYLPRNLYYANLGFPEVHRIEVAGREELHLRPNRMGTGIWWTSPLLLWLIVEIPGIVRSPDRRWLLAAVAAVYAALMVWHGTGWDQRGYNRYSLDYVPALVALVGGGCWRGWRIWLSGAAVLWSVLYFRFLL